MKIKQLNAVDCLKFENDIFECYRTNHLVLDSQNTWKMNTPFDAREFLRGYASAGDSCVIGIFDNEETTLYGFVIFDNLRYCGNKSCAEVHIVMSKYMFGKNNFYMYERILRGCGLTTVYAQIPSIAVHPIRICKKLGFKKTGYIPDAITYVNSSGEEKMYDIQIYTWKRGEGFNNDKI